MEFYPIFIEESRQAKDKQKFRTNIHQLFRYFVLLAAFETDCDCRLG
jgi:hypothetical protein